MAGTGVESLVDVVGYTAAETSAKLGGWLRDANALRAPAATLGALKPPPFHELLFEVERGATVNASTVTLSQLVGTPAGDAASACLEFTRQMFPDDIDAIHHELVISPRLYGRMLACLLYHTPSMEHVARTDTLDLT